MNSLFLIASLSLFVAAFAATTDRYTADDVHLNAVLPDVEPSISRQKLEPDAEIIPQNIPQVPVTAIEPELTTVRQATTPTDTTYFSRIITSIFEIPISVLTAVRNLLHNAATPKLPTTA